MQKPSNWDDVEVYSNKKPTPGYYILRIVNATEGVSKHGEELLKLELDICEGEFDNYFSNLSAKINKNLLLRTVQLTQNEKSLPFFKKLVMDLEASNMNYKFDFNPLSMRGRKIGAYLITCLYDTKYGQKEGLKIDKFFSIEEARTELGKAIVQNMKLESEAKKLDEKEDDLPF